MNLIAIATSIATLGLCSLTYYFLPRRGDHLSTYARLASRLPSNRLDDLYEYAEDPDMRAGADFWQRSDGLRGINRRLVAMTRQVRILQIQRRAGLIEAEDAEELSRLAGLQLVYTLLAYIESAAASLWTNVPHLAALASVTYHVRLSLRLNTLLSQTEIPNFI